MLGVEKAGSDYRSAGLFLHGSTIAINTILERRGAKTALLVTRGFRDIYEIGRINRPDAYNLFFQKHQPLVERALRFEVSERVLADGEIETPIGESEIARLGRMLAERGVEATAILFLNCYTPHEHEARAKAILERHHPQMFVSDFPNAKVLVAQLKPGDAFKIRSGGGGYGDPLERPIDDVREDVRQGYVSVKPAAELYGVVLDPETFEVDVPATETLRTARAAAAGAPHARCRRKISVNS
jgi:hypothetical protein